LSYRRVAIGFTFSALVRLNKSEYPSIPAEDQIGFMPSIETERLLLRMVRRADLDDLAALFADPQVMRFVGDGQVASREVAERALDSIIKHWQTQGFGRWTIVDKQTRKFVGFGGLRSLFGTPELVYHLARQHWGKGLATEAARAVLRFGFEERDCESIVAIIKPGNAASIRVLEKLGMQFEKETRYYDIDVVQYRLARKDFQPIDETYVALPGQNQ
jgi:ribosomal-protein-alanine N-acetyltransferase